MSDSCWFEPSFVASYEMTDVISGWKMLVKGQVKQEGVTGIFR